MRISYVFHPGIWMECNGDCPTHSRNECFFLPCTILREFNDGDAMIEVEFDHEPGFKSVHFAGAELEGSHAN